MELKPQSIVETLNWIELMKAKLNSDLLTKKQALIESDLYQEIHSLELSIKQLEKQDEEVREKGKELLLNAWLKKFENLDGTIIQLNETPWQLVIQDESLIPDEYKKTKTTISIDKTTLKNDIKEWLIIEWVSIEKDYKLVIKNK